MQKIEVKRPKQSYQEFVESMPRGKAPTLKDFADRYNELEEVLGPDKKTVVSKRSKENGEERAYQAFVLGLMELEEQTYFGMLTVRIDALLQLAIVPVLRAVAERQGTQDVWFEEICHRIGKLESSKSETASLVGEP